MPNTIVITKLQNDKVGISNNLTESPDYALRPSADVFVSSSLNGVKIVNDRGTYSFSVVDVEKVVRKDGTEITISDVTTLYNELVTYFFFDVTQSGGSGNGWAGEVNTFAELPAAGDNTGSTYLVKTRTGSQLTFNLKRSGFYQSDGAIWTKLNQVQFMFTDDELTFKDSADNTKQLGFQLSSIATGIRRVVTWQNKDIVVADDADVQQNKSDISNFYLSNTGMIKEPSSLTVFEDAGIVKASLEARGGGNLTLIYEEGELVFNSTPAVEINLQSGTNTAPVLNYIYILKSTGLLTSNITGFPDETHVSIGTAFIQSPSSVALIGPYKTQNWNDFLIDTGSQGNASSANFWIRNRPATFVEGIALTTQTTTNAGVIDNLNCSTTLGKVLRRNLQSFPAKNTATGDEILVVNEPSNPYRLINDLNEIEDDANGGNLRANNRRYNLVLWAAQNNNDADCKYFVNLPSFSYGNDSQAITDRDNSANLSIPQEFNGVGFLIARLTVRYTTTNGGTLAVIGTEDLRGTPPSTRAGGGSAGVNGEFSDQSFRVFDFDDVTKKIAFDAGNISTSTTRTITMPDADVDLGALGGGDDQLTMLLEETGLGLGGVIGVNGRNIGRTLPWDARVYAIAITGEVKSFTGSSNTIDIRYFTGTAAIGEGTGVTGQSVVIPASSFQTTYNQTLLIPSGSVTIFPANSNVFGVLPSSNPGITMNYIGIQVLFKRV